MTSGSGTLLYGYRKMVMQYICADLEAAFLVEQAQDRRTVLACLFCFDILTFVVRSLQLLTLSHTVQHREWTRLIPQVVNMTILWAVIYCINRRSRKSRGKPSAATQVFSPLQVVPPGLQAALVNPVAAVPGPWVVPIWTGLQKE